MALVSVEHDVITGFDVEGFPDQIGENYNHRRVLLMSPPYVNTLEPGHLKSLS